MPLYMEGLSVVASQPAIIHHWINSIYNLTAVTRERESERVSGRAGECGRNNSGGSLAARRTKQLDAKMVSKRRKATPRVQNPHRRPASPPSRTHGNQAAQHAGPAVTSCDPLGGFQCDCTIADVPFHITSHT